MKHLEGGEVAVDRLAAFHVQNGGEGALLDGVADLRGRAAQAPGASAVELAGDRGHGQGDIERRLAFERRLHRGDVVAVVVGTAQLEMAGRDIDGAHAACEAAGAGARAVDVPLVGAVPELRDRILFTLAMIIIVRLGVHITLPGVDAGVIEKWMDHAAKQQGEGGGNAFGAMLTIFAGGGLQQAGIFALGIMPYISASIMVQLMTAVVPKLARLAREDGGRQKITQYTRYITIAIALVQSFER